MMRTIDLFCGAGGITEGFRQAGSQCLYGNDCDEWYLKTFAHNHPEAWADCRRVEDARPKQIREKLGLERGELEVLVGGPPCQGFSINAPERFLEDPRNALFKYYIQFMKEFRPKAFLLENVPGMLSLDEGRVFKQILAELEHLGYAVSTKILFAAHYGVPQERWRLIILGSSGPVAPQHPKPTHYATARANFTGGRTMVFKLGEVESDLLEPAVTVGEAIRDLPRLDMGEGGEEMKKPRAPMSAYAKALNEGFPKVLNHYAAQLAPINRERLKHLKPGGSWRDLPFDLLPEGMKRARRSDHTKRYGRLEHSALAGTVMTKCDPHWGAVFLPDQDRSLTVREAARIQSFPDRYSFLGPRVSQYEQVGNAVPPLLAKAIAHALRGHLAAQCPLQEKAS
jgi:DNA (cytosine-5)-methyltransferase 1